VAELKLPPLNAMPLPPRSLTQVTRATVRLSLAVPAMSITLALARKVPAIVGEEMESEGARLSTLASATSSVTAFGSTASAALPPQPVITMQAAPIALAFALKLVIRFMIRVIDA
jgi:hypothetical protein